MVVYFHTLEIICKFSIHIFVNEDYYTVVEDVLIYLYDELAKKNNYQE